MYDNSSDSSIIEENENSNSNIQSFMGQSIAESVNLSELGLGGNNNNDDDDLDYSMTFEEEPNANDSHLLGKSAVPSVASAYSVNFEESVISTIAEARLSSVKKVPPASSMKGSSGKEKIPMVVDFEYSNTFEDIDDVIEPFPGSGTKPKGQCDPTVSTRIWRLSVDCTLSLLPSVQFAAYRYGPLSNARHHHKLLGQLC
jgi:hypothetical protein